MARCRGGSAVCVSVPFIKLCFPTPVPILLPFPWVVPVRRLGLSLFYVLRSHSHYHPASLYTSSQIQLCPSCHSPTLNRGNIPSEAGKALRQGSRAELLEMVASGLPYKTRFLGASTGPPEQREIHLTLRILEHLGEKGGEGC